MSKSSLINSNFFNYSNNSFLMLTSKSNCSNNFNEVLKKIDLNISNQVSVKQIHSNKIIVYNKQENQKEADGIITNINSNLFLSIMTADCMPIFIYDNKSNQIKDNKNYIPLIRATYIRNKNITSYVEENIKYNNYRINYGDIIMSQVGNVGSVCRYRNEQFGYNKRNAFNIKPLKINKDYLYCYFISNVFKNLIESHGTIVNFISIPELKKIKLKIPKNKQLITDMEPQFQELEKLYVDVKNADKKYKDLIEELKNEAIKQ